MVAVTRLIEKVNVTGRGFAAGLRFQVGNIAPLGTDSWMVVVVVLALGIMFET